MNFTVRTLALFLLLTVLMAHGGEVTASQGVNSLRSVLTQVPQTSSPSSDPSLTPHNCSVTIPNGDVPPTERGRPHPAFSYHGNGQVWTVLPPTGIIRITDPDSVRSDGMVGEKFMWWRSSDLVGIQLRIAGRRLDGYAPSVDSNVPGGYFGEFQASSIYFPTQGCWEITGSFAQASLTFTVLVVESEQVIAAATAQVTSTAIVAPSTEQPASTTTATLSSPSPTSAPTPQALMPAGMPTTGAPNLMSPAKAILLSLALLIAGLVALHRCTSNSYTVK